MDPVVLIVILIVVVIVLLLVFSAIRVVQQYERGVIFVLGRFTGAKGPRNAGCSNAPGAITSRQASLHRTP